MLNRNPKVRACVKNPSMLASWTFSLIGLGFCAWGVLLVGKLEWTGAEIIGVAGVKGGIVSVGRLGSLVAGRAAWGACYKWGGLVCKISREEGRGMMSKVAKLLWLVGASKEGMRKAEWREKWQGLTYVTFSVGSLHPNSHWSRKRTIDNFFTLLPLVSLNIQALKDGRGSWLFGVHLGSCQSWGCGGWKDLSET